MPEKCFIPPDPPNLGIKALPVNPCDLYRKQDLPPAGGYPRIPWKFNGAKKVMSGYMIFGGYLAMTGISIVLYAINFQKIKKHEIEMVSHKMAIYPILLAERDREYLRTLRKNRDEEERLMKPFKNWEVGKYYKERVYYLKNIEEDLVEPIIFHEYFVHADPRRWKKRADHALLC